MSEGKNISSVPVTADVSHLLCLTKSDGLGKLTESSVLNTDVSKTVPVATTIGLTDFIGGFVTGQPVGRIVFENQHSEVNKRVLVIGKLTFSLQKFDCLILRSIGALGTRWSSICFALLPARGGKMYFVNTSVGSDADVYEYEVRDAMDNVVVEKTTVRLGRGGKRFAFSALRITERRMVA